MSHPYRTAAPLNKVSSFPPRRPPTRTFASESCDCCGWDLPRDCADCYWYKYVWCRNCLEHYREELASRGMVLGHPAYHSYIYPMSNNHDIEICRSVVQDYHIPAVFYYKFESFEEEFRQQSALIREEKNRIKEIESRGNVLYSIISAVNHVVARFMP
jgi:hypothetical protein